MELSEQQLENAVSRGILTREQLAALQSLSAETVRTAPSMQGSEGEEQFKFVRGFGDVFIAIGVALLIGGLAATLPNDSPLLRCAVAILLGFGLGEWLLNRKRLALPGAVLILGTTLLFMFGASESFSSIHSLGSNQFTEVLGVAFATLVYVAAFYFRYRLPFSFMVMFSCLLGIVFIVVEKISSNAQLFLLPAGLLTLAVAIAFDKRDRRRTNVLSDCGFWLHILAAPLITHGLLAVLGKDAAENAPALYSVVLIGYFIFVCGVALFLDRRALLVSSFIYVISAIAGFISSGVNKADSAALAVIIVGGIVLLLGVYWHQIRNRVFARAADSALAQWVPPFRSAYELKV